MGWNYTSTTWLVVLSAVAVRMCSHLSRVYNWLSKFLSSKALYNLKFHPLARYNGPLLWRVFRFPFLQAMISGDLPHRIKRFHDQYGFIVRVAPDELSFTNPAAWKDIHLRGFARPTQYKGKPPGKDADSLITASEADHSRFRKILAPAFSDIAIHEQEHMICRHVDLLISKLHDAAGKDPTVATATVDMLKWLNYTTFDIIGDFVWGSSFHCLERVQHHPWLHIIAQFKGVIIAVAMMYYSTLHALIDMMTPKSAMADIWFMWKVTEEKISQRLPAAHGHGDLISHIMTAKETSGLHMSRDEIEVNSMQVIIAGSESLTTVLLGTITYLVREPEKLRTLVHEVRTSFQTDKEINAASLKNLAYLNAVLSEGLRLCPTIPDGMRRLVPKGGAIIAGEYLPENTVVSIPQWASYQSPSNYHEPRKFLPERWLANANAESSVFGKDRKDAFNPFSLGPHNCPGRALAWLEMRLILGKIIWHFDMRPAQETNLGEWGEQKIYWFWEKRPTPVKIRRVR